MDKPRVEERLVRWPPLLRDRDVERLLCRSPRVFSRFTVPSAWNTVAMTGSFSTSPDSTATGRLEASGATEEEEAVALAALAALAGDASPDRRGLGLATDTECVRTLLSHTLMLGSSTTCGCTTRRENIAKGTQRGVKRNRGGGFKSLSEHSVPPQLQVCGVRATGTGPIHSAHSSRGTVTAVIQM